MERMLACYAEGQADDWEGYCLDLDIAVQGASFEEVRASLEKAIAMYAERARTLPEKERKRLLNRSAPWSLWLRFAWSTTVASALRRWRDGKDRAEFTLRFSA